MYEEYWKLNCRPFHNTPDAKFFYHSVQHDEALMKLTYAVTENMGAALLTGAYGCGKTLLSRVLLQQIGKANISKSCLAQPAMTPLDLLRGIAREMTAATLPAEPAQLAADALREMIEKALIENRRDGKHTVLIIDEAHLLDHQVVLETLRLLLNFQSPDEFLLTLLLLGHLELAERVTGLKQLAQRIPITCILRPFDSADTAKYIQSRLAIAGRAAPLFQDDALNLIYRYTGGIPRRINTLCDVSLALGSAQKTARIDTNLVLEAIEKFGVA